MKSSIKHAIAIVLAVVLLISCVTTVYAETVYYYYGYLYTYITNYRVSLYGLDDGITELVVPSVLNDRDVVDIRNYAFFEDTELTSVDFLNADHLERIGYFAFSGCTNLQGAIIIPSGVTTIERSAFENCSSIGSAVIDAAVSKIPDYCFNGCTNLSTVTLGESITEIGNYAFTNCPNLTYVEIPAGVTVIESTAFDGDTITLGVYTDSAAHQFAVNNDIPFILLDAPVVPTEPPTEAPTEAPTEPVIPTEEPTIAPTEQPTETSGYYLGDVNGDNTVDVIDSTLIQRYLASVTYPDTCVMMHGDVDGDGVVTILDATYIGRYNARIDVRYPIGEWQAE